MESSTGRKLKALRTDNEVRHKLTAPKTSEQNGRGVGTTPAGQATAGPIFSAKMGVVNAKWATGAIHLLRINAQSRNGYLTSAHGGSGIASATVRAKRGPSVVHMRILARENTGSKRLTTPTSGCGFHGQLLLPWIGVAERMNRTLVETIRSVLADSKLRASNLMQIRSKQNP